MSDDRLRWRPRDAVTPDMREVILANKAALIKLLTGPTGPTRDGVDALPRDHTGAADSRPVWIHYSNGYAEKVYTFDRIPPDATYWCREGDKEWQPLS